MSGKGKQRDLSTPWSDWIWSEEHSYKYATRTGPTGEIEYDYLDPEEVQETPRFTADWTPHQDTHYQICETIHRTDREAEGSQEFQVITKPTRFFKVGRVFKMEWSEPAGGNSLADNPRIMTTPLGGKVFIQMRHFVVVREMKGCCICLSLFTYNGQATTKKGIHPEDYAIVYPSGGEIQRLAGESLSKEPFPIIVENTSESIHPMSRLNFGRVYTVEHNVKVLKVGRIPDDHHARLSEYLQSSMFGSNIKEIHGSFPSGIQGWRPNESANPPYSSSSLPSKDRVVSSSSRTPSFASDYERLLSPEDETIPLDVQDQVSLGKIQNINRDHTQPLNQSGLHYRYTVIDERKQRKFWKPGRVFMMLWTEPGEGNRGGSQFSKVWLGEQAFSEIRRFVVIGDGYGNVICSPIHTYHGRATLKPNLAEPDQHAIIHTSSKPPKELCEYDSEGNVVAQEMLTKDPIRVIRELNGEDGDLGTLSRINYAKIYTVEKYVRVQNIGRVHEDSMESLMDSCFFARPEGQPPQGPRKASHQGRDEPGLSSRLSHHHRRKH